MKKFLKCTLILMFCCFGVLLQRQIVFADSSDLAVADVSLYHYETKKEINDSSVYAALQMRLYENGVLVKTMRPLYSRENYAHIAMGQAERGYYSDEYYRFKDNKTYEVELVLPDGYELRKTETSYSRIYQVVKNRIRFVYDVNAKNAVEGEGGSECYVSYFVKTPSDPDKVEIEIPKRSYFLTYKKRTIALNATALGNQPLTYKSSNSKVVSVNNKGIVTVNRPGKATITVMTKRTGKYYGDSKTVEFKIYPKRATINKINSKNSSLIVSWKKDATVSGYKIDLASDISFRKNVKHFTVTKASQISKTIKKLKKGDYYFVRIYSYVNNPDKTVLNGSYSSTYKIRIEG